MEGPIATLGRDVEGNLSSWQHVDRVIAWQVAHGRVHEEMAMQMDRVGHHGVVDEGDPHPLALAEQIRRRIFAELPAVEAEYEPLHVAGKADLKGALRRPHIRIRLQRDQILVDQDAMADALKPLARLAGGVHRHGAIICTPGPILTCGAFFGSRMFISMPPMSPITSEPRGRGGAMPGDGALAATASSIAPWSHTRHAVVLHRIGISEVEDERSVGAPVAPAAQSGCGTSRWRTG